MNGTTWRVLRTEVIRGIAPLAAVAFAGASAAILMNETQDWVGRWLPFAEYTRVTLIVLIPLAVAAGAWQAGREHRRRMADQLVAAARPQWRPIVVAWAAVTFGMVGGMLLAWAAALVLVAPVASHHNGAWLLTLAVAIAGIVAASALGVVVGRLVRSRLAAPIAGLLTYVGLGIATYEYAWRGAMLVPSLGNSGQGTTSLAAGLQTWQLLWFGALTASTLMLVAVRQRWLVLVPGAIAVVASAAIVDWPVDERRVPDAAATELVCTDDGGPEVCLARVNAFLLNDAVSAMREQLVRWEGVDGGFDRVVDGTPWYDADRTDVPTGTVVVSVTNLISWNARFAETDEYGHGLADEFSWALRGLVLEGCGLDWVGDEPYDPALEAASWWARGGQPHAGVLHEGEDFEPQPAVQALLDRSATEQRDWMGRYLGAARVCDTAALTALAEEL